jgi:hypothetical protein
VSPALGKNAAAVKPAAARESTPPAPKIDDKFWDEGLDEPVKRPASPEAASPARLGAAATSARPQSTPGDDPPKKKRKKFRGIKWGFDWGKVAGGGLTFLIAGGITLALVVTTGRLYFWPAGIAVVGLFTCLSGLMGEEGIW